MALQKIVNATNRTAFLTGGFSAVGMSIGPTIKNYFAISSAFIDVLIAIIFIFIPAIFFVIGKKYMGELGYGLFGLGTLFKTSFWIEVKNIFIRMLCWLFGVAIMIIPIIILEEVFH